MRNTEVGPNGKPRGKAKSSDGITRLFEVKNQVEEREGTGKQVVFDGGREQWRFGYYTLSKEIGNKGKWRWVRSTPMRDHTFQCSLVKGQG